jgi:hypothetical protein
MYNVVVTRNLCNKHLLQWDKLQLNKAKFMEQICHNNRW